MLRFGRPVDGAKKIAASLVFSCLAFLAALVPVQSTGRGAVGEQSVGLPARVSVAGFLLEVTHLVCAVCGSVHSPWRVLGCL